MIAPNLLVGLGGTGSKIVMKVSKLVTEEQREHLGFAVFDTDINELRDIQRANPFIKIIQTSTKLSVGEYLNIDTHARDTWFPVNAILNSKTLTEGAGQVRAISRLAFDTAIRAGKMEQLHEAIQDLYRLEEGQSEQALRVIIVSSLAGGTGSGLILPVGLYIKNYLANHFRQSANITRGFFILPEVFEYVIPGQAERSSLRSNAYATLRELDAFLMKGDATLPPHFNDSVRIEFPRVSSDGYEEYNIRPYDFCFLFDAQNVSGTKLNSFNQYLDHAANCIYAQSIGPMNKRSNSSEDNTIRRLAEERGRNRYAGAGSSMLVYPVDDVQEYIALNWANEGVSKQWLAFDEMYKDQKRRNANFRAQGLPAVDPDPIKAYTDSVENMAKNKDPFARSIANSCYVFDADGLTKVGEKWDEYIFALKAKIKEDASSGSSDLDQQSTLVRGLIGSLDGGEWEPFIDSYHELEKYRAMIQRRCEDSARTIAYTMFMAPVENVTGDKEKFRLETYMRDESGSFIHPNAVRYFLYKTLDLLKDEKRLVEVQNKDALDHFETFPEKHFKNPKTDEVETVESLSERKRGLAGMVGKMTDEQEELKSAYLAYLKVADDYRVTSILAYVIDEGINYVSSLCDAFQSFFANFESRIPEINKRIREIEKKYANKKGMTTRYVCASETCLKAMLSRMVYMGSQISIDGKLSEDIYTGIRKYAMMLRKPQNSTHFNEIFEKGIIGYYKNSVMRTYGNSVDMDIITALQTEVEITLEHDAEAAAEKGKKFEYSDSTVIANIEKIISNAKALSAPFIEKPLGMERQPINACAFNPCLLPGDDSPRSQLVEKELKNYGGVADEDISKNMILFYQSIYGLRANELSKFAPPESSPTSDFGGGEYYKAYFELIDNVHPATDRSKAITPHIDRWWHIVTKMPDLDDGNQERQEQRIYAAFFWALLGDYVDLFPDGPEKEAYRLNIDDLDLEDASNVLLVSNGTPCDRLYEALDAFAIYPKLVDKMLERIEDLTIKEVDEATPIPEGILYSFMKTFHVREFELESEDGKIRTRSMFDIPFLMKRSIKPELYNEDTVVRILKAEISEVKRYLLHFCTTKELSDEMGKILRKQFEMFIADIDEENKKGRNFYHDYLFSRTCSVIAKSFEELGLFTDSKQVQEMQRELSK